MKNQRKRKERQLLGPCPRTKNVTGDEGDGWLPIIIGCTWNDLKRLGKEAGRVGNRETIRDHSNNNIVKIDRDSGDLRRFCCL